jgi:hypothetical protein
MAGSSSIIEDIIEEIGEDDEDTRFLSLKLGSIIKFPKEGWLHKQGHFMKNWQKRYFSLSLHEKKLFYYTDESKQTCKGEYRIDSCSTIAVKDDSVNSQYSYLFILHANRKGVEEALLMSASDKESRYLWIIAIEEVIKGDY